LTKFHWKIYGQDQGYKNMWLKFKQRLSNLKLASRGFNRYRRLIGVFLLTILLVTAGFSRFDRFSAPPAIAQVQPIAQTPEQRLEQGRNLYESGQFSQAVTLWSQAARDYQRLGQVFNQALTLNYLSSAYQELGEWSAAETAINTSMTLLQSQEKLEQRGLAIFAQTLNNQGSLQLAQGQTEAALATWIDAETAYQQAGNKMGQLGSQINQAQALQSLGQYRRSKKLLENLVAQLQNESDSLLKAESLRSLGIALQTIGDLLQSKDVLEQSWQISDRLGATNLISANLFSIGNIARDLGQYSVAFDYYQSSIAIGQTDLERVQIQLNQLSLLVDSQQWSAAANLSQDIQSILANLSPSRSAIYARVNLAASLIKLSNSQSNQVSSNRDAIADLLITAVQQARDLSDARAEAYSLNQLGKLYAQNQQWADAEQLTQKSLEIAQRINADDIAARGAAQLGSIHKNQGNIPEATIAYTNAYETLQSLRSDLVAINPDVQFNFTETIEPVYRELVGLLLQPDASQANLIQAREVIEALQLAELDNFFRDACLETKPVLLDEIDSTSAVIYPIILPDRLEVILSLPDRSLRHYATPLAKREVESVLQQFYSSLYQGYSSESRLQISQQIYDWLIRPAAADLTQYQIKNLVFVLDGFFRSLPMAALHDGQNYLVEKYSLALSPGLQLFAEGLQRQNLKALTVGLTEARQGFTPLPGVAQELTEISQLVDSQVLLDREFTRDRFQEQVNAKPFRVVHLATHGQFSSNPEETFLLTWDDRINVKDFAELFQNRFQNSQNPVELLVLSACQTAAGDRQATLGLAGFALRSGARSTLATLWSVSDQSTADLMSEFYRQLTQPNLNPTKAEALRQAQLSLLNNPEYNHPYFWAPFVLVGNWL